MSTIAKAKLLELAAKIKAAQTVTATKSQPPQVAFSTVIDRYGKPITLNQAQQQFVQLAGVEGKSAVLIGAAGTGKTTCQYAVCQALIESGRAGTLAVSSHKFLQSGTPGIVICSYTRRAVSNIRKNLPKDLQQNAITIHKLLEYQPVYNQVLDLESGEYKTKMSFEATRNAANPLPSSIHTIIFEESSMIGTDLHKEVIDACPHNPQIIYLGDIQQLPPVFGPAILGFKLLELPVIELTEVYRQALESPIISLAHRILSGKAIIHKEFPSFCVKNKLTLHPWKKKIDAFNALNTSGLFFVKAEESGLYDPEEDMILIPFNKAFGTIELNNKIANHLARKRCAETYQIIAGFNKVHLSPGDKILYDKEDAVILSIEPNPSYIGQKPAKHSLTLDYWGHESNPSHSIEDSDDYSGEDVDFILAAVASKSDDRTHTASHVVTIQMLDSDTEIKLDKASDINSILLGYALTVHKAQGSEWRKVFFVTHQSHATMLQRELLYTAVTRAKEELYVICEPETFQKGIENARIRGTTLQEKAEYFKGKLSAGFVLE